tara:strand:- start:1615 stop:2028 length:414 start_codon:yes stop_codon:yes gene_type:complete
LLRINVWISLNGLKNSAFTGVSYPYTALCPSTRQKAEFKSISDVYDEIMKLSDEAEQKGFNVGEAIYTQSFFFADHSQLVDTNIQNRIKEYQYCKQFNCPPYPSLYETPANIIDDFFIIEEEINQYTNKKQKEQNNA